MDALDQVVGANKVSARSLSFGCLFANGKDHNASGLTGAVGQGDGAAHKLVCFAGIYAQADGNIHGGIEVLGGGGFLDQLCCFKGAVDAAGVDFLGGSAVSLRTLSHVNSLCQKNCVVRAESRGPFHDE